MAMEFVDDASVLYTLYDDYLRIFTLLKSSQIYEHSSVKHPEIYELH